MPNATHTRLAATATRLIASHGRTMQLVTIANSGDAWNPTQGETTQDVTAVQSKFSAAEVDGDLIKQSDKLFLLDSQIAPEVADRLRDGSTDYSIVNVDQIKPGDVTCLYKVQARL